MRHSRRYRDEYTAKQIAATFGLVLACLLFLYPMALMAINSFKSDAEMYLNPAGLPRAWTLESYGKIFKYHGGLWWNYVNSVVIAASSTALAVFLCALAAFAFAKYPFRGRNLIFSLLLATMMVPPEIVIPGLYVLFAKLQWINTLRAQILPTITPVLGCSSSGSTCWTSPTPCWKRRGSTGRGTSRSSGGSWFPPALPSWGPSPSYIS